MSNSRMTVVETVEIPIEEVVWALRQAGFPISTKSEVTASAPQSNGGECRLAGVTKLSFTSRVEKSVDLVTAARSGS